MDTKRSEEYVQDNLSSDREVEDGYESLAYLTTDNQYELSVLVSGVHCAGCIQKIESSLTSLKNIQNARLNFSTNRLNLSWKGSSEQANDYVKIVQNLGYGVKPYDNTAAQNEVQAEERFLLLCLGISGFAMGNIMLLSFGLWITDAHTMGFATREFMHWIQALIALPTVLLAGRPFFRSAFAALSKKHTNMDVPISLALILASGMSVFEMLRHGEHVYFDSAVMLMFFLLIGRYLDFRARKQARSSATDLLNTLSGFATVIEGEKTRKILIRDLKEGMKVRVSVGDKFPVDGELIEGESEVDTSLITGETVPRKILKGENVFAGTINLSSPVLIQVSKAAEDSLLADIVRLMEKAGQGQAAYVRIADKAAKLYTPVVHSFAGLAFLGWFLVGGMEWQDALIIAITVLIITCPCALGLAVPVVQVLATGRLMKKNILVKSGDALERLSSIDTILFDKTGTLTLGHPVLKPDYNHDVFSLAASLASHSRHPLSRALAVGFEGNLLSLEQVEEIPGKGMQAIYQGKVIQLGSRSWCGNSEQEETDQLEIWLSIEGQKPHVFYFKDTLRGDAHDVIKKFQGDNVNTIILSGDRKSVAESIADECGIKTVYAEKTPVEKFEILQDLRNYNHKVLMVGDGLNDAPVLAGANVSIAPGTAVDMAQNAADIIFMGEKLSSVYEVYNTARKTQILVKQNFMLAVIYNIIAVPLALAGMVTPMIAAICMSGSSLIVIANSFRLRLIR
ncbi:MAG: heavy metal translocating P-type ATPase [Alphaproteobacteria bacterium]|nr:heavy metal translocating P-type ATPase [Alphaproteobacteria bacterium]